MSEYANNHYVPQLILRRFGDKLNLFNVQTKEFRNKRNLKNVFKEKRLYSVELENKITLFESTFVNLLDNKILHAKDVVQLTRDEVWMLVQYAALAMLRTPHSFLHLKEMREPIKSYQTLGFIEKHIEKETNEAYSTRTIEVILESKSIGEVFDHPAVTYEACKWASLFNYCCLSILDSTKANEDFIISDVGMTCEHDKSRFKNFFNLCGNGSFYNERDEMIKNGYIYKKVDSIKNDDLRSIYFEEIIMKMMYVHANYYIIPISSTRTILFINPFFKQFYNEEFIKHFGIPNVWPTLLSKEALKTGTVKYESIPTFSSDSIFFSSKDLFTYEIKNATVEDVIIINCMAIDRINEWLGFDESSKILRTLSVYSKMLKHDQRNNYDALVEVLKSNGHDLLKSKKYEELKDKLIRSNFTTEEMKCVEFFYDIVFLHPEKLVKIFDKIHQKM